MNIEKLVVDGGAGDDRFFVLGTGAGFTTEIDGGLGSDFVSVLGPTPGNGVIANDLLGHSGIITNDVESSDTTSSYNGLPVVGISANVADNDTPGAIIILNPAGEQIVQSSTCTVDMTSCTYTTVDGTENYFDVVLTRPPDSARTTSPTGHRSARRRASSLLTSGLTPKSAESGRHAARDDPERDAGRLARQRQQGHVPADAARHRDDGCQSSWDAPAEGPGSVKEAIDNLLASHGGGTVSVSQTGTSYAITFDGGAAAQAELRHDDGDALGPVAERRDLRHHERRRRLLAGDGHRADVHRRRTGTSRSASTTQSTITRETIAPDLAFNNAVSVSGAGSTIVGNVASAVTVEQDAAHPENDYAVLVSQQASFQNDLPSAALPEGLRGEHLKITSGDPEAQGQVAMILGSYAEDLTATGTFSLSFAGTTVSGVDGVGRAASSPRSTPCSAPATRPSSTSAAATSGSSCSERCT